MSEEAQYILDARRVREAAVAVADLAPPLAEALHLKAQDIFEAGEALKGMAGMSGRLLAFSAESVWLIERAESGDYVVDRASWGNHMPKDHEYAGPVYGRVVVGRRFSFACVCGKSHFGYSSGNGQVASGRIEALIERDRLPA